MVYSSVVIKYRKGITKYILLLSIRQPPSSVSIPPVLFLVLVLFFVFMEDVVIVICGPRPVVGLRLAVCLRGRLLWLAAA